MIGIYVTVPVACFRKGLAREYLETELIPPPSTCYGFLLSLVGEEDRTRHTGVRVTPMLLGEPDQSVVLRTVWRVKNKPLGSSGNTRPDYQQLLTGTELILWVDSTEEQNQQETLESRIRKALDVRQRADIQRFGGLSLGESTHLADQVSLLTDDLIRELSEKGKRLYQLDDKGLLGLPVWVDHVGSAGTVHVVGNLVSVEEIRAPELQKMPLITAEK
jgi:CRISPR-associated protein Cas5t